MVKKAKRFDGKAEKDNEWYHKGGRREKVASHLEGKNSSKFTRETVPTLVG